MVNKEKNMGFKIAIFDLDGTLVDSLEAISKLTNLAFEELGMETYSIEMARTLIGHGVVGIADKVLPQNCDLEKRDKVIEAIRKYYNEYYRSLRCFASRRGQMTDYEEAFFIGTFFKHLSHIFRRIKATIKNIFFNKIFNVWYNINWK